MVVECKYFVGVVVRHAYAWGACVFFDMGVGVSGEECVLFGDEGRCPRGA